MFGTRPIPFKNAAARTRSHSAGLVVLDESFEPRWSLTAASGGCSSANHL